MFVEIPKPLLSHPLCSFSQGLDADGFRSAGHRRRDARGPRANVEELRGIHAGHHNDRRRDAAEETLDELFHADLSGRRRKRASKTRAEHTSKATTLDISWSSKHRHIIR